MIPRLARIKAVREMPNAFFYPAWYLDTIGVITHEYEDRYTYHVWGEYEDPAGWFIPKSQVEFM